MADLRQQIRPLIIDNTGVAGDAGVLLENVVCDASVAVSDVVRMSAGVAVKAKADSVANSNFIGIVEAKPTATSANIRVCGVTPAIFVGLDETKEYFLSNATAGALSLSPPTGAGHVVVRVGQPLGSTKFVVTKGVRMVRS